MARPGRLRFAPSHREKLRAANASNLFYASMAGEKLAPELTNDIKPKRAYTKREGRVAESSILDQVKDAARAIAGVRVWRNTRGTVDKVSGGKVKFGVGPNGAADLIGWKRITVTPAMVGSEIAVFVSIETKAADGDTADNQRRWHARVRDDGGITGFARSAAEAEAILRR